MNYETLTNIELRVKVAEKLGWTAFDEHWCVADRWLGKPPGWNLAKIVPAFDSDLNACTEMEKAIPDDLYGRWVNILKAMYLEATKGRSELGAHSATARQRCLAFLKVME